MDTGTTQNMMHKISLLFALLFLGGCMAPNVCGKWVEPVPGMPELIQGFVLRKGGSAESVNMATLQYQRWTQDGRRLHLSGESIGNGQVIPFTEEVWVESVDSDTLILRRGTDIVVYHRQPEG